MDVEIIEKFFLWGMLINLGIYIATVIAFLRLRNFICKVNAKLFKLDDEAILKATLRYIATYKLIITAFFFAPWVAILIIK